MTRKRWVALLPAISLGVPLGVGLMWSFTSTTSGLGIAAVCATLMAALAYITATAVALGVGAWLLWRKSWCAAASCLLLLAMFVALIAYAPFARTVMTDVPDYIHFLALSPHYLAEVASIQAQGEPRLRWFLWRDASGMSGETLIYLVYDESDEFSRPDATRSGSWRERAKRAFTAEMGWPLNESMRDEARHLLGHYYVVAVREP